MQEESFWEFIRKISPRKEEKATQMEDKEGRKSTDPAEIREI